MLLCVRCLKNCRASPAFTSLRRAIPAVFLALLIATACRQKETATTVTPSHSKNVLIITIDTLRADALSVYGNHTRTPFFESLASRSVVFDRAYTCAPLTLPAHTSLFTGLYPPSHGVRNNGTNRAADQLTLLAELAEENGFHTAAFVSAFPLSSQFRLDQGFTIYDDALTATPEIGDFGYAERNAQHTRLAAQQQLGSMSKPFFVWMHLFDPHHPYLSHAGTDLPPYQQEVLYVDQQLTLFFDFLESRRLLEDTLVILTADHGEAFGEHGEISHSLFLYNTTLRIPLFVSGPGLKPRRRKELVRIIDIFPTVAGLMRWKFTNTVDGISLLPLINGETMPGLDSYAETLTPSIDFGWSPLFALQNLNHKYIEAPKPEWYDLNLDPQELRNRAPPTEAQKYRSQIQGIRSRQGPSDARHALTTEDRERMESLGYTAKSGTTDQISGVDPKDRVDIAKTIAELSMSPLPLQQKAAEYQKIAQREPANPLLLMRYAEILLKLKSLRQAETAFRKVISIGYPSASPYNGLAATLYERNKLVEAEHVLNEAVKHRVADGETYFNLAEFHFARNLPEQAMVFYDQSIAFEFLPAYFKKAAILEASKQTAQSLEILQLALKIDPSNAQIHFEMGMIYHRSNQSARALNELQTALQKKPEAKWLLYYTGMIHHETGNAPAMRQAFQEFLSANPPGMENEKETALRLLKPISQ